MADRLDRYRAVPRRGVVSQYRAADMVLAGLWRAGLRRGDGAAQRRALPLLLPAWALRGQGRVTAPLPPLAAPAQEVLLSVTTSGLAINSGGDVAVYDPPNWSALPRGYNIAYGTYQPYNAGDILQPGGVFQLANGSGSLQAVEIIQQVRAVVISSAFGDVFNFNHPGPLSTGVVGVNPAGFAVRYIPPNAILVPRGQNVSYGPWNSLEVGQAIGVGVWEIPLVAGENHHLQAANSGFIRNVTIAPL